MKDTKDMKTMINTMDTKTCTKCGKVKELGEFVKNSRSKDGRANWCISCSKDYNARYYKKNREKIIEKTKNYSLEHSEKCKERRRLYKKNNKDKIWAQQKDKMNRDPISKQKKLERCKRYRDSHRESIAEKAAIYRVKESTKENRRRWDKERTINDLGRRLHRAISANIRSSLKKQNYSKLGNSCSKYLPFTVQQLKEHLEKQFEPWMCWENYGPSDVKRKTWQIDHIAPQSYFNYQSMDCDDFKKCWALENLRPLDALENDRKGDSLELVAINRREE